MCHICGHVWLKKHSPEPTSARTLRVLHRSEAGCLQDDAWVLCRLPSIPR